MSATLKTILSPSPVVTRGKSVFVNGDPKGNNLLYCSGNAIIIRNMNNLLEADMYYEHPAATTVAKYSPSGNYIASGDVQGNLRIWDTINKEHILKITIKALSGAINDIAWTSDNQRLIVVGDGKEKFGVAILWDSGSSVGEITGHSKQILSCDVKPTRPFRAATGSEDFVANWFEGPPFKFKSILKTEHSRFVNCVRFSPDGEKLVTVSSDKKGVIFDGKTGEKLIDLAADGAHAGGIYCVSWSPDSKQILTASGDKTCKVWDAATGACTKTFTFGSDVNDQQLGCLWQGDSLLSVNLNGDISYLDETNTARPKQIVKGHNKLVSTIAFDRATGALFSSSIDGVLLQWDLSTGLASSFSGPAHKNQITSIKVVDNKVYTCAKDDSAKISSLADQTYGASIGVDSPAVGIAVSGDLTVTASMKSVYVIKNGAIVSTTPAPYEPTCISTNGSQVAVGGKDKKIYIYTVSGNNLTQSHTLDAHRGELSKLAYSPSGALLAAGDTNREVIVWDGKTQKSSSWVNHTGRVNAIDWSQDSKYVVSGGLDSQIFVWDLEKSGPLLQIKNSHKGGVNEIVFTGANSIASAGNDNSIKIWNIQF
ncbi:hypothetical protein CYY_009240 [Polysphondylium violaceum]|uniref:WD40 repeat-containing protein n=1 Tax=Polysphondylium violaceum TaxID=133409 RepID=A0A8J4PKH2_9MYCE|nr:hypothetical protein CYY_009240 [Polysphondylium violaceum]